MNGILHTIGKQTETKGHSAFFRQEPTSSRQVRFLLDPRVRGNRQLLQDSGPLGVNMGMTLAVESTWWNLPFPCPSQCTFQAVTKFVVLFQTHI